MAPTAPMTTADLRARLIVYRGLADAYGLRAPSPPDCPLCGSGPAETAEDCDEPRCPSLAAAA